MSEYVATLRLRSGDVDMYRRLRLSRLFALLQEAAVRHTEELGMGRDKTLDLGLHWVVTLSRAEFARLPVYDEEITLRSWPGETMHVLFPRYYEIADARGALLVRASSLWALVDATTRSLVSPEEHGVVIAGQTTGRECPLPHKPAPAPIAQTRRFTVPYSYVDLNGHMNNARYLDLAEDLLPEAAQGRAPRALTLRYASEARLGEELAVGIGREGSRVYLDGAAARAVFSMELVYGE